MLCLLPSAQIAYLGAAAAAAVSLPPTATNHMILKTHWRSSDSVVSSAQRYRVQPKKLVKVFITGDRSCCYTESAVFNMVTVTAVCTCCMHWCRNGRHSLVSLSVTRRMNQAKTFLTGLNLIELRQYCSSR